jgi:hypothetical protein
VDVVENVLIATIVWSRDYDLMNAARIATTAKWDAIPVAGLAFIVSILAVILGRRKYG